MADGLKLALYGLHRGDEGPEVLARRALRAEAVGFEGLWVGDHLALPPSMGDYPRLEALVTLAYLAAVTSRVRLVAGVVVLPQRQPVLLAKQLSSIDRLSGGRLTVGIGVGYVEEELRALGASLADRGARTDEYLAAMRALWDERAPAFDGRFVAFADVVQRPLPVQRPHPPIVIGGHSPAAYRRAVVSGDGWFGWDLDLEQTAASLAALREAAARHERPAALGDLEITVTPRGEVDADRARLYADLGVHRLALQPRSPGGDAVEALIESAGETVVGRV